MTVEDILETLGINRTYLGYWILRDIVTASVEDEEVLQDLLSFYEALGMKYNRTANAIEKNIRTAVGRAWRVNKEKVKKMARYELTSVPCNGEFIDILTGYLLRQQRKSSVNHNSLC